MPKQGGFEEQAGYLIVTKLKFSIEVITIKIAGKENRYNIPFSN